MIYKKLLCTEKNTKKIKRGVIWVRAYDAPFFLQMFKSFEDQNKIIK